MNLPKDLTGKLGGDDEHLYSQHLGSRGEGSLSLRPACLQDKFQDILGYIRYPEANEKGRVSLQIPDRGAI